MDVNVKLAVLDRIYAIYDDFAGGLDVACRKSCALCCTCNVTLTTLEGYQVAEHLIATEQSHLLEKMESELSRKRFQPTVTINALAEDCMQGKEPPEESSDPAWGPCLLLKDDECPVYRGRPFGCRCMLSKQNCQETGFAEMDSLVLTVNNLFLQYIEHIDAHGFSGNLTDVLAFMAIRKNRRQYRTNQIQNTPANLIANRPIKVLMIPPEHRAEIQPILDALQSIRS
jgi:Fe-S-cluster containining protein